MLETLEEGRGGQGALATRTTRTLTSAAVEFLGLFKCVL